MQMVPDECREFFLWEPMEKHKPWPRWKKTSPINLRGAHTEIMKLDIVSRRAIEEFVNEGEVQSSTCLDFTSRQQVASILKSALGQPQTEDEISAVIAFGKHYLRNLHRGRSAFRSRGEHEVACNVNTADMLSRQFRSSRPPDSPESAPTEAIVKVESEDVSSDVSPSPSVVGDAASSAHVDVPFSPL